MQGRLYLGIQNFSIEKNPHFLPTSRFRTVFLIFYQLAWKWLKMRFSLFFRIFSLSFVCFLSFSFLFLSFLFRESVKLKAKSVQKCQILMVPCASSQNLNVNSNSSILSNRLPVEVIKQPLLISFTLVFASLSKKAYLLVSTDEISLVRRKSVNGDVYCQVSAL